MLGTASDTATVPSEKRSSRSAAPRRGFCAGIGGCVLHGPCPDETTVVTAKRTIEVSSIRELLAHALSLVGMEGLTLIVEPTEQEDN